MQHDPLNYHGHRFSFFAASELDQHPPERIPHLALVDQAMVLGLDSNGLDPLALERMPSDRLRELIASATGKPAPVVTPLRKPTPAPRAPRPLRTLVPVHRPPLHKAQIWWQGRSYHLGYFESLQARAEAVAKARARILFGRHPQDVAGDPA